MKLAEMIKAALQKRATALSAMEGIAETAEKEGRLFNDEETRAYDGHKAEITALDAQIKQWRDLESLQAATAAPAGVENRSGNEAGSGSYGGTTTNGAPGIIRTTREKVKGAFLARYAHCLYKAGGNQMLAAQYAEQEMKDRELAGLIRTAVTAADTGTAAWAGELIAEETRDFIDLLRPLSVYADFPSGSVFSFDQTNSIKVPRMTTGTPGGFVGEGQAIPVAKGAFDNVALSPKKMGVITVATREVLERSTPALETILRDSMLSDTATVLDRKFLSNAAASAGVSPAGLFHTDHSPSPLSPSNTGTAIDDAIADITAILNAHYAAKSPLRNAYWVMHDQTRNKLMNMRNAVGVFYFRDEINAGKLQGYPIKTSTLVDITGNGGGTPAINDLALVDASMLIKGVGLLPRISMSDSAAVHMETAPAQDIGGTETPVRSLWQTESVGLRLTYEIDYNMRHKESIQWIDAITW